MPRRSRSKAGGRLPTREEILDYVKGAEGKVGRREIARAFGLKGAERGALAKLLRELADEGLIGRRRRPTTAEGLPPVLVVEVTGIDLDGDPLAAPADWRGPGPAPTITILPGTRPRGRPPGIGDRALVRARRVEGRYEATVIRVIAGRPGRVVGVYERGGRVRPVERRARSEFVVAEGDALGARPGDVVLTEAVPARRLGLPQARVIEVLESLDSPRAIGVLVINSHGIPFRFPEDALAQAGRARPAGLRGRKDLRDLALVTIDDEDARDFDDAVFAEPAEGGWHAVVAIADVAHYVRPGDAIDREARRRGNSVYLPDMVVPMLPEALSNGLCSLKPGEDRAVIAAHLWIDGAGKTVRHRFERALMRSAARLTYRAVEEDKSLETEALYAVFRALRDARRRRGALDIDLPERRVLFDERGAVTAIEPRPRYDSHRLIEELMIAANVAAAETLVARRAPCMFRLHDRPPLDKLEGLREYLAGLGYRLARDRVSVAGLNQILAKAEGKPEAESVALMVLRAQAQAEYGPRNIGHFGLNLRRYAHFTSPIRRYADLLVHRSLIAALGLGAGGTAGSEGELAEIGAAISSAERRAVTAERDALDRFATRSLAERVGASFAARVTGVTRFGLFVELAETGAQGLVPMRDFPEYMVHDSRRHRLVGRESKAVYALGEALTVTLREADTVTGLLRFELAAPR